MDKLFPFGRLLPEQGGTEMQATLIKIGRLISLVIGTVTIAQGGSDLLAYYIYAPPWPDLWTIVMAITLGFALMWFYLLLSSVRR